MTEAQLPGCGRVLFAQISATDKRLILGENAARALRLGEAAGA